MPTYNYLTKPGEMLRKKFLPGYDPYAATDSEFIREYSNGAGATRAEASITPTITGSAGSTFDITVSPVGMAAFTVTLTLPSPVPTGQALMNFIRDRLVSNASIAGLGRWTATTTAVVFTGVTVGQSLTITSNIASGVGSLAIVVTNGQPMGLSIAPGRVVVTNPTIQHAAVTWGNNNRVALLPSEVIGAGNQRLAGVSMVTDGEDELIYTGFPTGLASQDQSRRSPSVRVKETQHITVELETAFSGALTKLYYRHAADGAKNQLGIFSATPGTGLAEFPSPYRAVEVTSDGLVAVLYIGA